MKKLKGRPRTFSVDAAIETAAELFAAGGYESTTISDLTHAMGITASSLYAAVGSKEALFERAFAKAADHSIAYMDEIVASQPGASAITRLLHEVVASAARIDPTISCIAMPAVRRSAISEDVRRRIIQRREALRGPIVACLERAKHAGELSPEAVPEDLGRFFWILMLGMIVEAQHDADPARLMRIAENATASAFGTAGVPEAPA